MLDKFLVSIEQSVLFKYKTTFNTTHNLLSHIIFLYSLMKNARAFYMVFVVKGTTGRDKELLNKHN